MKEPLPYRPADPAPFRTVKVAALLVGVCGAAMVLAVVAYARVGHNPIALLPLMAGWVLLLAGAFWYLGIRRTEG